MKPADPSAPGAPRSGSERHRYLQPFQICPGPAALPIVQNLFAQGLLDGARILPFQGERPPEVFGPAILVLCPADLRGTRRGPLLDLMHAALPGRPVLYGGTGNRDVLLDAINNWRVSRIVPDEPRPELLLDGIRKAQAALELECGVEQAAAELRAETQSLEAALRVLRETEDRTRRAERLATLGRITSSLIPVIGSHLDALQDFNALLVAGTRDPDPRLDELLNYAFTGIRSLHAMLDEIRSYAESRPEVYRLELEDADAIVQFVVSFCRYDPLAGRRRLTADLTSQAKIRADSFRLYQSLINLLRNAFQATPPGGDVVVRTSTVENDVLIDVENTGDPIPADIQARLFEPFFSTKGDGGMGLGLSTCKITIERHGGTITCTSAPGQPTRFRIRLPRA
jgi:signal transduction histidine kinase